MRPAHPNPASHRIVFVLLVAMTLFAACQKGPGGGRGKGQGGPPGDASGPEAVPVETATVKADTVADRVMATATISSKNQVTISSSASGHLVEITVDEGDLVDTTTPIGRIKNPDLKLSLDAARSQTKRAKADVDRLAPLQKKGYIPRAEYDAAVAQLEIARSEERRARAGAGETVLRSPIEGVVATRHAEPGTLLGPSQPIVTVVDPGDLEVDVKVPEVVLGRLRTGLPAEVVSDALDEHVFPGAVTAIAPTVDPVSGTIKVTVHLDGVEDEQGRRLRPGMFVEVSIITDTREDVPTVPKKALLYEEARAFVMAVRDGKAVRAALELGVEQGDRVEVVEGVSIGDEVIVLGHAGLKDGADVRVVRRDGAGVESSDVRSGEHASRR